MTNEVETGAEYDDAFAKFSESELPALSTAPKEIGRASCRERG